MAFGVGEEMACLFWVVGVAVALLLVVALLLCCLLLSVCSLSACSLARSPLVRSLSDARFPFARSLVLRSLARSLTTTHRRTDVTVHHGLLRVVIVPAGRGATEVYWLLRAGAL